MLHIRWKLTNYIWSVSPTKREKKDMVFIVRNLDLFLAIVWWNTVPRFMYYSVPGLFKNAPSQAAENPLSTSRINRFILIYFVKPRGAFKTIDRSPSAHHLSLLVLTYKRVQKMVPFGSKVSYFRIRSVYACMTRHVTRDKKTRAVSRLPKQCQQ